MQFEVVASHLCFPEGPISLSDGSVLIVEIQRGNLTRILSDGTLQTIAELRGGPNGAAVGPDGKVYVCNNGGMLFTRRHDGINMPVGTPHYYSSGSIQRVDIETGHVELLYESCDGVPLNGPNDIVFDEAGGFWFTDMGKSRETSLDWGGLFYAKVDGSHIVKAGVSLLTPNGIGLSPDNKILWVAETLTSRVWGYDIESPGELAVRTDILSPGRVLGPLPGYQLLDSLAVEASGKLCVATAVNGGISIYDPDGSIQHIRAPDPIVSNICFGGKDMQDTWITGAGRGELYKLRWPRPGLRLNYNA